MEWKEKERRILEAVRTLMREGRDLGSLKTEEIAQAAGLGKGTLYLYFPSKEILIEQGIRYVMQREAEEIATCAEQGDFAAAFSAVLRCMRRFLEEEAPALQRVLGSLQHPDPAACCPRNMLGEDGCRLMQQALDLLYQKGLEKGLYPSCADLCYLQMAFVGATAGFFNTLSGWPEKSPAETEQLAVRLFVRALQ